MNRIKETRNDRKQLHSFDDLPSAIYEDGSKYWHKNGKIHRDNDLPAAIYDSGYMAWYNNGNRHRETGAAVIWGSGARSYYLNGKQYDFHEWLQLTSLSEEQKLYLVLEHE